MHSVLSSKFAEIAATVVSLWSTNLDGKNKTYIPV